MLMIKNFHSAFLFDDFVAINGFTNADSHCENKIFIQ